MNRRLMMMSAALFASTSVALAAPAPSPSTQAATNKPGTGGGLPPPYTVLRWNEDYSYLKDSARRTDFWDPIKYIPLGKDDFYLSLGGQLRERYEHWDNFEFDKNPQTGTYDGFFLHRFLGHADLHLGPNVRVFGQVKSALEDGRTGGPRGGDADEFDINQLFIDVRVPWAEKASTTVRFGRQDLLYGAQRLISPLDWANTRRTFEGLKLSNKFANHELDLFWVRPVVVDREEPNVGDKAVSFAGVYDTISLPDLIAKGDASKMELYFLALNTNNRPASGVQGPIVAESDTYTIGMRFASNPKPWDIDIEGSYQFGDVGASGDISAWAFSVEGGYTFAKAPLSPRLFLGFDVASGDQDPSNPDSQRFNQLFPLVHAYYGYADLLAKQNTIDLHPGIDLLLAENQPYAKKLTLRAEYHLFWRQSDDDGVFTAPGPLLRGDNGSNAAYIGSEIDLLLNWQLDRHISGYLGYSHVWAGSFIENTGPSGDVSFFYAALMYTF